MMFSVCNDKKKIKLIMKKHKFCEFFDAYIDNIEYFSIWDINYMKILCTEQS